MGKGGYKTAWVDNKAKYNTGDVVLVLRMIEGYSVGVISELNAKPVSKPAIKAIEKRNSERRVCCGMTGKAIRENLTDFHYKIGDEFIYEGNILGGIEKVNEHIKDLNESIDNYRERLEQIRDIA